MPTVTGKRSADSLLPPSPKRLSLPLHYERQKRLLDLMRMVQGCRACPRMEGRARVLSQNNGKASVKVMFIAEAPGRNGADRTSIPLHGDPSGNNFEGLLDSIGWKREEVFVTNCVLCNPRDENGNNAKPNDEEFSNCSFHLEAQIRLVNPLVICTLGASPLYALTLIEKHDYVLNIQVATAVSWNNRTLFPLYHPSPRAVLHRNMKKQMGDFAKLYELVKSLGDSHG